MDEQLENRLRFLRRANTETMPHSERGLFDHLLGTCQLLLEWGADHPYVMPVCFIRFIAPNTMSSVQCHLLCETRCGS